MKECVKKGLIKIKEIPLKTHQMLQFFKYDHLPEKLQAYSKPFHDLATSVVTSTPCNFEQDECLRKLLEAKDCAVRATLFKEVEDVKSVEK